MNYLKSRTIIVLLLFSLPLYIGTVKDDVNNDDPGLVGDWKDLETKQVISLRRTNGELVWLDFDYSGINVIIIPKKINGDQYLFLLAGAKKNGQSKERKEAFLMYKILPKDDYFVIYEYSKSHLGSKHLKEIMNGELELESSNFDYDDPVVYLRIPTKE